MDWILFVFTKGNKVYLVPSHSLEYAWDDLASRQSCSVENCKRWYNYETHVNGFSSIKKIKIS